MERFRAALKNGAEAYHNGSGSQRALSQAPRSLRSVLARSQRFSITRLFGGGRAPSTDSYGPLTITLPDGTELSAVLARPRSAAPCTGYAIVMVHGFAAEKTENGLFVQAAHHLVSRGHWVLLYDWRGLGESKGVFRHTDLDDHTKDLLQVVHWLQTRARVNSSRLIAIGFSLGATIIGLALEKGLKLGAVALLSPALRPKRDMYPRYSTREIREELDRCGFIQKNSVAIGRQFLESLGQTDLSPEWKRCGLPILVGHGTADARIPYPGTKALLRRRKLGNEVTFKRFGGASHSFRPESRHWPELCEYLSEWLDRLPSSAELVTAMPPPEPTGRR